MPTKFTSLHQFNWVWGHPYRIQTIVWQLVVILHSDVLEVHPAFHWACTLLCYLCFVSDKILSDLNSLQLIFLIFVNSSCYVSSPPYRDASTIVKLRSWLVLWDFSLLFVKKQGLVVRGAGQGIGFEYGIFFFNLLHGTFINNVTSCSLLGFWDRTMLRHLCRIWCYLLVVCWRWAPSWQPRKLDRIMWFYQGLALSFEFNHIICPSLFL